MSTEAASSSESFTRFDPLRFGREVIRAAGQALFLLADRLRDAFCQAVQALLACRGSIEEATRLIPSVTTLVAPLIATTGNSRSALARAVGVTLD